ncbi:MAG: type II toxin-antitoxin system RelE/ParE family toxin [Cyclobacteriaceae bacterium]|nr:type II toxin-antitoxin system RelE/ParE family toxin [Cyclobacteriaceae bacterium]
MALKVVWTDEANEDLDELILYLEANWTHREIKSFFRRLEDCIESIRNSPQRQKDSLRKRGVKEYQLSKQTTIFYNYNKEEVHILRLWLNVKDSRSL